jgi:3-hydroxybutyryl-CoA dehydratase
MSDDLDQLPTAADFQIGQRAAFRKTVTEADLALFVAVTGDTNPLHVDEVFARRTFFGARVVHGLLAGSLVSTVIGTLLPGTGAIYREQSFRFRKPVRVGDTLTASVEVRAVDAERGELRLATAIGNQKGETVIDGEAVVSLIRRLLPSE